MLRRISKKSLFLLVLVGTLFLIQTGTAVAHGDDRPDKKGILLVAFGTSVPEAQVAFKNIEEKVKAAFPDVPVRWAYTSHIIREKLAKEGQHLDSPVVALAKMKDEGFTHVAVQSLHTIPGEEYHDLVAVAHSFKGQPNGIRRILVGNPLLAQDEDLRKAADAMLSNVPDKREKDEAVIFMGHGTHHPGNAFYPAFQYYLWKKDANAYMGTVEGSPSLDDIMASLKARGVKKAYLIPFMSVAGDHAQNDMAGPEDDSWKSILTKAGIECETVLKGTAEYDNIVEIWVEHLKGAMSHFK